MGTLCPRGEPQASQLLHHPGSLFLPSSAIPSTSSRYRVSVLDHKSQVCGLSMDQASTHSWLSKARTLIPSG